MTPPSVRRRRRAFFAWVSTCVALVVVSGCLPADAVNDVTGHPGMHTQTFTAGSSTTTVYWRTSTTTRGGLVLVHGGGWTGGQRSRFTQEAMQLADSGYVAATVDYRLADGGAAHAWPVQREDTLSAWRALRSRQATYRLDATRLAIAGESAGGHIVLSAVEAMLPTERPVAVVSWSGPTDLTAWMTDPQPTCRGAECVYYTPLAGAISGSLLRCTYVACRSRYDAASPARNVAGKLPPTLQTFFARDIVPDGQGRELDSALRLRGGTSVFRLYPGFGHGATWTAQVWQDTLTFLTPYVGAPTGPSGQPKLRRGQDVTRIPLDQLMR